MPPIRTPEQVTGTVLVVTTLFLVAYAVFARVWLGEPATVSAVIADWCHRWPIVAFGLGLVVGHWLWQL